MRRHVRRAFGRILNIIGAPGFIRASACHDRLGIAVEVRIDEMFTVVTVKNIRLLFHRLTGKFDGVVVNNDDCRSGSAQAEG